MAEVAVTARPLLALAAIAAAFLVRLLLIEHSCCHDACFRTRADDGWAGRVIVALCIGSVVAALVSTASRPVNAEAQIIMKAATQAPLSAIIGCGEMRDERIDDGVEAVDLVPDLGRIQGNARHLLGLINDRLDISRVESGRMDVYADKFDVGTMVDEVVSGVAGSMMQKDNRLVVDVPGGGLGTAHTDVVKLRQISLNPLGNAAKFTEAGIVPLQRCRGREHPDQIVFSITGISMTEPQVGGLVQRFHQADASITQSFGGTGLDLAISKAFGAMLGDDLTVAITPGLGSTFTVRLPVTYAVSQPQTGVRLGAVMMAEQKAA